jgi:hypothetical protein
MKKIKLFAVVLMTVVLSSCARGCQEVDRSLFDNVNHNVKITQYSGGKLIGEWTINGIVNNSSASDGYYFYTNGKLVEVSGDIRLEYLD